MSRSLLSRLGWTLTSGAAAYGVYVVATWLRYGHAQRSSRGEVDPLLDRFMPDFEVRERYAVTVEAPAEVTFGAAGDMSLEDSRIIRAIFKSREFLLRARPGESTLPRGLLAQTKVLGWGVLDEVPGREIVMGAVTKPWEANVVFRAIAPEEFASFQDPDFVKIAWTLRIDPIAESKSVFSTETRALACGPVARSKFRKYWAFLSPGIILIRLVTLGPLKREAERRARQMERTGSENASAVSGRTQLSP